MPLLLTLSHQSTARAIQKHKESYVCSPIASRYFDVMRRSVCAARMHLDQAYWLISVDCKLMWFVSIFL